jgi:hypothetical protein
VVAAEVAAEPLRPLKCTFLPWISSGVSTVFLNIMPSDTCASEQMARAMHLMTMAMKGCCSL